MIRHALVYATLLAVLVPVTTLAAVRITISAPNTMRIGGAMSRVSASTASREIALVGNTCYSEPAAAHDVLRKNHYATNVYSTGAIIAIDIWAKNPGTCSFTFSSKGETNSVQITVSK